MNDIQLFLNAVAENEIRTISRFLEQGLDINATDEYGRTALMIASEENAKEIVELLIENGADVNATDKHGGTSLIRASSKNAKETVEFLIMHGADMEIADCEGWTALMYTAMFNKKDIAEFMIENGVNINATNNYGQTALMIAAEDHNKEIVELLIENGADVNAVDRWGDTALMMTAGSLMMCNGYDVKEFAELLVGKGADVNVTNKKRETPLMWVIDAYTYAIDDYLDDYRAMSNENPKAVMEYILSEIGNAAVEITKLLLTHGADINVIDDEGKTALMYVIERCEKKITEIPIVYSDIVDTPDEDAWFDIMWIIQKDAEYLKELLLEHGAK